MKTILVILATIVLAGCVSMRGCGNDRGLASSATDTAKEAASAVTGGLSPFFRRFPGAPSPPTAAEVSLRYFAAFCMSVAALCFLSLIASIIIPIIPKPSTAVAMVTAIGCALGAWVLEALLAKFFETFIWAAGIAIFISAAVFLWPIVRTAYNVYLDRLGKSMLRTKPEHADAAGALLAAARGLTKPRHADARKDVMKKIGEKMGKRAA